MMDVTIDYRCLLKSEVAIVNNSKLCFSPKFLPTPRISIGTGNCYGSEVEVTIVVGCLKDLIVHPGYRPVLREPR